MNVDDSGTVRNLSLESAERTWSEEFAENAYGGDDDPDPMYGNEEPEITPDGSPSEEVELVYKLAGKAVRSLLADGDIDEARDSVVTMNSIIEGLNIKSSARKEAHKIQVDSFERYRKTKDEFRRSSTTTNQSAMDQAYRDLRTSIEHWQYPKDW